MPRQPRDKALSVEFYRKSVLNKAKSWGEVILDNENRVAHEIKGAGRAVHENIDYVHIEIPGDKDCTADRPVTFCPAVKLDEPESWDEPCRAPADTNGAPRLSECDVHRFVDEFKRYKKGHARQTLGAALQDLPGMDPATIADLGYFKITTIEQLAALKDSDAGGFLELRQKARDWLAAAQKTDAATGIRAELEATKSALKAREEREAAMQKQIDELIAGQKIGAPATQPPQPKAAR